MPQLILIRRAGANTPVPIPVFGPAGEMAWARGGFTNSPAHTINTNDLLMSDGTAFNTLIGPTRQVEVVGAQTINGAKTFGANVAIPLLPVNPEHATSKDYVDTMVAASTALTDGVTIDGDGTALLPITLRGVQIFNTAGSGLNFAGGLANLLQASQTVFGGAAVSTDAEIDNGTADNFIISPRGLRTQTGASVTTLDTTAKTIVPAINELYQHIVTISGVMILVGSYNAATDSVAPGTGGFIAAGPLPPASAANNGHYVIVSTSGTGIGNAPPVAMINGDWVYSDGAAWQHLSVAQPPLDASNIAVVPPVGGQNTVQAALEWLEDRPVLVDALSITGDGLTVALTVAVIDGGTF